jgi:hypothetical protein
MFYLHVFLFLFFFTAWAYCRFSSDETDCTGTESQIMATMHSHSALGQPQVGLPQPDPTRIERSKRQPFGLTSVFQSLNCHDTSAEIIFVGILVRGCQESNAPCDVHM